MEEEISQLKQKVEDLEKQVESLNKLINNPKEISKYFMLALSRAFDK